MSPMKRQDISADTTTGMLGQRLTVEAMMTANAELQAADAKRQGKQGGRAQREQD